MKYIVLGDDNKEYGPIDAEVLRKWAENGRITAETKVRNSLIKKWNLASEIDFLQPALAVQMVKIEEEKGPQDKLKDALTTLFRKKGKAKSKTGAIGVENTSFRNVYIHQNAGVFIRLASVFLDCIIFFLLFIFISIVSAVAVNAGSDINAVFEKGFVLFFSCVAVYYGLTMGLYAQTFGMWFCGLIIVRKDLAEVYLGRAYAYAVLMILLSVLSPIIVFLNPQKRSIHEMLTGTMIIRTSARPKT